MTHPYPDDESLFSAAVERPAPERAAFLDGACGGDLARRARVEALLRSHGRRFAAPRSLSTEVYALPDFKLIKTVGRTLVGMHGVAFSPDGTRLAIAASFVDAIRLFDTERWEPLLTLEAPASTFLNTAFSPDGTTLGAMSQWGSLHLWRAPSWAEIEAAEKTKAAR